MRDRPGTAYAPPLDDIWFVLEEIVDLPGLAEFPPFQHADPDLLDGVLSEAGRFVAEVVAPSTASATSSAAGAMLMAR